MNKNDVLASWAQVANTDFGKWLTEETNKAEAEAIGQSMQFSELAPLLRVQGFRAGITHWQDQLADMRRKIDLEAKESRKPKGIFARIGLGGNT